MEEYDDFESKQSLNDNSTWRWPYAITNDTTSEYKYRLNLSVFRMCIV